MKILNRFLKQQLTILAFVFTFSIAYSQKNNDLMNEWNSEIESVGNRMVGEIDAELNTYSFTKKIITSKNYKNGLLVFYRANSSIIKITKSYSIDNIQYLENYYYKGKWPIYVDRKKSTSKDSEKFYFDKINLILWISENNKKQNTGKKYKENWDVLLQNMDKFSAISKMDNDTINEDEIKIPE